MRGDYRGRRGGKGGVEGGEEKRVGERERAGGWGGCGDGVTGVNASFASAPSSCDGGDR